MGSLFLHGWVFAVGISEGVIAPCVSKVSFVPEIVVKPNVVAVCIGVRGKELILYCEHQRSIGYLVAVLDGYVLSCVLVYAISWRNITRINKILHAEFWKRRF